MILNSEAHGRLLKGGLRNDAPRFNAASSVAVLESARELHCCASARYVDLRIPTIIIAGDRDTMVSPQINARVLAATLPSAKLIMLKDVGHMPHHAAPEVVADAIDELVRRVASHCRTMDA
jgi:pimeloyl-ACP methyl ester carboxylesterase